MKTMENQSCIRVYADVNQIKECKSELKKVESAVGLLSNALNLAGNDVRLKILYLIDKEGKVCVCDLSDILEMKIPAVSQHLRKLKDGGILKSNKVAQTIFYSLSPEYKNLFNPFFQMIANNKVLEKI